MTRPGSGSGPDDGRPPTGPAVDPVARSGRRARGRHAAREDDTVPPGPAAPAAGLHGLDRPRGRRALEPDDEPVRLGGRHAAPEPSPGYGLDEPARDPLGRAGRRHPEPDPASGFPFDQPALEAAGTDTAGPDPLSWPVNGHPSRHDTPRAPTGFPFDQPATGAPGTDTAGPDPLSWPVNGHPSRHDTPRAPTGFPFDQPATGTPSTDTPGPDPLSWPVNGHPSRHDAATWLVDGQRGRQETDPAGEVPTHARPAAYRPAPDLHRDSRTRAPGLPAVADLQRPEQPRRPVSPDPPDLHAPASSTGPAAAAEAELAADDTQVLRRYVPANEVLDREAGDGAAHRPSTRAGHPPRAVVRRRRARRRALEWPVLIVFALLSAYLIRAYVVQTFYIPSASMHETLLEGDRVLVNKTSYHLHGVHRGDVVVFRRPPDFPVKDDDLIKRVVGLPGEIVQARGGTVYVDGVPLTEPYVEPTCQGTRDFPRVTVPPDTLWVMGDNRCNSSDSRVFGPIREDLVVGRAFVLAWPVGRLAWL